MKRDVIDILNSNKKPDKSWVNNFRNLIHFNLDLWQAIPFFIGDRENRIVEKLEEGKLFDVEKIVQQLKEYNKKYYEENKERENERCNKYWEENLSLALQIVKKGEEMYPGLFRHVLVRDARYNQHLNKGSLLVEVGATGNTLEEAYYGARCFANILSKIYK